MKEIWINLELYFESYEFYNFQGFFRIFLLLFSIENHFEKNKKNKKRGLDFAGVPRGCDVALRATWQRHAGPRGAYAAYTYMYDLYSLYI